jgi:TonB family protein
MAAILSILPGIGQMYNGETRKGLLFLCVSAINFVLFLLLLFTQPIVQAMVDFGANFHMRPNVQLIQSLMLIHIGSPASLVVIGLFVTFIAYAMRDAYDHAAIIHRRHIYPEYVMQMPEATSGSYIFHFSILIAAFILAFFFLIPPPPRQQVTDIEFVQNQTETKEKVVSPRHAQHNSKAAGHHENKPVVAPSPAPKSPSKPAPEHHEAKPTPTPTPHPTPHVTPRPTPTPTPTPHPTPSPSPHPTPTPTPTPKPMAMPSPTPTPFAHPSPTPSPRPSPSPSPMAIPHGSPTPSPMPRIGAGAGHGATPSPAPAPISSSSGTSGGGAPAPSPISGGGAPHVGGGTGPSAAPAPSRSHGGGSSGGPAIAVAPSVPRPQGGGGGEGIKGNPDANNNEHGRPSASAQADVDFGPYMADLQRRIKRAWYPPKGNESKRVMVIFKIHKDGTMSNLRLDHSSGLAIADQAALKAVENAAPFRPLPAGAQDDVDIQFTFDYNVFAGGGRGVMRSF